MYAFWLTLFGVMTRLWAEMKTVSRKMSFRRADRSPDRMRSAYSTSAAKMGYPCSRRP